MPNRYVTTRDSVFVRPSCRRYHGASTVSGPPFKEIQAVKQINMGIIGTGWCGGIRADTCAINPAVKDLHIVETRPERLAEVAKATGAKSASDDYRKLLEVKDLDAVMISATPEALHYPMARDCLEAGLHVFMEKPIAVELHEADDLIAIANRKGVKFTIGYSQRFNPKYAYVKKCLDSGAIGTPVSALVSRHIQRSLGAKITGRSKLSPAAMEATHDLDFILWCLAPAKPIRVYSQTNYGVMRANSGKDVPDTQWITVTMDSGMSFVIGAGWSLPPGYPNACSTWIEMIGTDGALMVDDTHRDVMLNTMKSGMQLPMSSMPGERVDHAFAGPMHAETVHFIEAVCCDRPVLVTAEEARNVMELYVAADISAERNEPVNLPLPESRPLAAVAR
jgi:predicted dehydrogenase